MHSTETTSPATGLAPAVPPAAPQVPRYTTAGLMQDKREIEIEHAGRIYRLRITQLNKLILTA
ncbi:hemin uptake protein HemP [Pseudoduganella sp. RAF53_2]|uniref:hemin uptake protein HemP n=1 Tax=unclassified Pseudoduganella TaxID=2637179 RepID=UPI003F9DBFF1